MPFNHIGPHSDREQDELNFKQYGLADDYRKEEIKRQIKSENKANNDGEQSQEQSETNLTNLTNYESHEQE